jgi:hypothetical protein
MKQNPKAGAEVAGFALVARAEGLLAVALASIKSKHLGAS